MNTTRRLLGLLLVGSGALALPAFAQVDTFGPRVSIGGANIMLPEGAIELSHTRDTEWKVNNLVTNEDNMVSWFLAVRRLETTPDLLTVHGIVRVHNTGTASATIGNIVVSLQKKVGANWVSAAANCNDATLGDEATTCQIVGAASRESVPLNLAFGASNYSVDGAVGTFTETAGSGLLSFMDASTNTVFALSPTYIVPPGAVIDLLFTSQYNNTVLGLPVDAPNGDGVRAEVLVSFGNAGFRTPGGSCATSVDIDGDSSISLDETRVKTVSSRMRRPVPSLEIANDSVTLRDTDDVGDTIATGTLSWDNLWTNVGQGSGVEVTSANLDRMVSVRVLDAGNAGHIDPHPVGGVITNEGTISGSGTSAVVVNGRLDETTGEPIFSHTFPGVPAADFHGCATLDFGGDGNPMCIFCSYTQGGWGADPHGHNPGMVLQDNFPTVYPSGVEVGIPGGGGFSMTFTSASAVNAYLPAGGPPAALNADLVDPVSSSSGVFGGQVLALQINVDFMANGIPHPDDPPYGPNAFICNTGTCLDGLSVDQVLALANTALGGGGLPCGFSFGDFNDYVTKLNEAFDNCEPSTWAQEHICRHGDDGHH